MSSMNKGLSPLRPCSSMVLETLMSSMNKGLSPLRPRSTMMLKRPMSSMDKGLSPLELDVFQVKDQSISLGDRGLSEDFTAELDVFMLSIICRTANTNIHSSCFTDNQIILFQRAHWTLSVLLNWLFHLTNINWAVSLNYTEHQKEKCNFNWHITHSST